MYKHILLPTDGSALSRQAVAAGIGLARALGASVIGMHVLPHAQGPARGVDAPCIPSMPSAGWRCGTNLPMTT